MSSPLPRAARIDARDRAWVALRAGDRALRAGDPEEALRELGNAQIAARQAGLPGLERTLRTREVAVLIRLGRETEEDLRIADDLTEGQRHQRLFDFAAAYHLAGRSEEAVTWYRRTLDASRTDIKVGRPRWELLRGLVLVLLELDRPGEAREAIATTRHALRVARWADDLEKVVRWRSGAGGLEPLLTADRLDDPAKADSIRYWSLEILVERGEQPPDRLLELVQADRRINSEARPLVMSLEAELLRTLGRTEEGDQLALEALARAQTMARTYPVVHSHLGLVRERAGAGTDGKADGRLEPTLAEATLPPIAPVVPDSPLTG